MARRVSDIHPADLAARVELRHRLRRIRAQAGLSTQQIAVRMGIDAANMRRLERRGG